MSSTFKYIFLVLLFFQASILFSQDSFESGSPLIQNYADKDYGTNSPQNWAIVQDFRGVMYVSNTEGILEYDGKKWRLIKTANNSIPWALALNPRGTVFVGAIGEFGYLAADNNGVLSYVSLLPLIEDKYKDCGEIKDICVMHNKVFFFGTQNIYILNENKIEVIETGLKQFKGFCINKTIYLYQRESGLFVLDKRKIEKLPFSEEFISLFKEFSMLALNKNKLLIGTRDKGLKLYDVSVLNPKSKDEVISYFSPEASSYLIENQLMSGYKLNNEDFAFGTLTGGIIILEKNGKIQNIINRNKGLRSNGVYCMMTDRSNNLWAGLVNGIAKIDINSPVTKYSEQNNIEGLTLSVGFHKKRRYFGTTNGVYYMPDYKITTKNYHYKLRQIRNTESSIWDFFTYKEKFLTTGPTGLIELKDTIAVKHNDVGQILSFASSKYFENYLFLGLRTGIAAIRTETANNTTAFKETIYLHGITSAGWNIVFDKNGDLWYSDRVSGIHQIKFTDKNNPDKFTITDYDTTDGFSAMYYNIIYPQGNRLLVGSSLGVYEAKESAGKKQYSFVPENTFGKIINENKIDVKLIRESENKIWISSDKIFIAYVTKSKSDNYELVSQPFEVVGYVDKFFVDSAGEAWFCTNNAVYRYNPNVFKNYKSDFSTLIRKVSIGLDSIIFGGAFFNSNLSTNGRYPVLKTAQEENNIPNIKYKFNSISFEFSSLNFENEAGNEFSYILEGFDDVWSKWSTEGKKEYTNLREGDYIFKVKSKNIYGFESSVASYTFTISPPWYRTWLAYISYVSLAIFLIYIIIKAYTKRLLEKNMRLEKIVAERTAEVEQQKEELMAQTESLEITNQELEKLSIVARETDNAIVIMDADGNFEWINESLKRLFGYDSLEHFVRENGRNLRQCSSASNIEEIITECLTKKKAVFYENFTLTGKGNKFWAQTTLTPVLDNFGNVKKIVAIDTDITKIKEAEEEIKQQNEEITAQRELLSQTNNELTKNNKLITDSIKYAKRIQEAILPSANSIQKILPESFVFFRPRDIVSGDFYWISKIENKIFIAIADCTGHGVPGAFMSMIGNTILNEIIIEKKISVPSKILELLNLRVVAALEKGRTADDMQTDGMDISVCCINTEKKELQFAGANTVAYLYRECGNLKLEGDIYSIGDIFSHNSNVEYTNQNIAVSDGDMLYMFSDGYQDQFGGPDKKKFMAAKLEELFVKINKLDTQQQHSLISSTFEEWKGTGKQTDDVLMFGARLKF